jgi:phosphoserine phosphatase
MNPPLRIVVSIDDQNLQVMQGDRCVREFPVSTATKGMGFEDGSYRTPVGRFVVCEKIGDGAAEGTIFKNRVPSGQWQPCDVSEEDLVLTRILRLDGLDPQNANSLGRCIYIHGTNRPDRIGEPASHGCIRLGNADVIELFDLAAEGTLVEILPVTKPRGKLWFIDCDSTLSAIEGIDELGRLRGEQVFAQIASLTDAAMNGEVPIAEVFSKRMEMIRPDRALCEHVAKQYVDAVVPGMGELIAEAKKRGWLPVILSGGFAPLIQPLARKLGIDHVEAVPLFFHEDASYAGYGIDYPTTRNLGKNEVIREWRRAMLPERVVMMGDGVSDRETKPDVDLFIGFGGVVARPSVQSGCDCWITAVDDIDRILDAMDGDIKAPLVG